MQSCSSALVVFEVGDPALSGVVLKKLAGSAQVQCLCILQWVHELYI